MGVLNIVTSQTGLVGVIPRVIFINTNNTSAEVQAAGYLTKERAQGYSFSNKDMALVSTTDAGLLWMDVVITSTNISLTPNGNSISSHDIQAGIFTSAPDTGLADAYIVNLTPAFNPLTQGALFTTVFQSANTGASTITVNGATYDLVDIDGSPLAVGAILIGQFGLLGYDGTNVQLLNSALDGSLSVLPSEIQDQTFTFAADDGAADSYHADYSPVITAYTPGMRLTFSTLNANTGASTFAANALGATAIVLSDGSALTAGDIPANSNVDVMRRVDGDWQLMSASPTAGSGVSPTEIQNQVFIFAPDESGVPDAYVVTLSPVPSIQDGTFIRTSVNSTNTGACTLTINGNPYTIALNDGLFSNPVAGDLPASVLQDFQIFNSNYAVLMNPAVSGASSVTPTHIQNQSYTSSPDSGVADAYVGTYTPQPSLALGATFILEIANTNLTTSPTLDVGDGSGPLPIVLGDGSAPPVGSIPAGLQAFFTLANGNIWQILNPSLTASSIASSFLSNVFLSTTPTISASGNVLFDSIVTNDGSAYSTVTGNYTVPADGNYIFNSMLTIAATSSIADAATAIQFYVDGTTVVATVPLLSYFTNLSSFVVPLDKSIDLVSGQTLSVRINIGGTDTVDLVGNAGGSSAYFTAVKSAASGSIDVNSTIQTFLTLLSPISYSSGSDQVYVFDAITLSAPITYSAGTFTTPSGLPKTWEIIGQFYMTGIAVESMRLYSTTLVSDFLFSSPVTASGGGAWCYINWRGQIQAGSSFQVLFTTSASGQFENGTGITSFMTIRQI